MHLSLLLPSVIEYDVRSLSGRISSDATGQAMCGLQCDGIPSGNGEGLNISVSNQGSGGLDVYMYSGGGQGDKDFVIQSGESAATIVLGRSPGLKVRDRNLIFRAYYTWSFSPVHTACTFQIAGSCSLQQQYSCLNNYCNNNQCTCEYCCKSGDAFAFETTAFCAPADPRKSLESGLAMWNR